MGNRFYAMEVSDDARAVVRIFGDVTAVPWYDSDLSAHTFAQDIEALGEFDSLDVLINSYGGDVAEGISIYNELRRLAGMGKDVRTVVEGMACSIASVIFMAGDERVMRPASMLFLHDCQQVAHGDADDLRRVAEDLDKVNELSRTAYMRGGISGDDLTALMKGDTWLSPDEAVSYGLATKVSEEGDGDAHATQSALPAVFAAVMRPTAGAGLTAEQVAEIVREEVEAATTRVLEGIAEGETELTVEPDPEPDPEPEPKPDPEPAPDPEPERSPASQRLATLFGNLQ